jgi:hypothetical protein
VARFQRRWLGLFVLAVATFACAGPATSAARNDAAPPAAGQQAPAATAPTLSTVPPATPAPPTATPATATPAPATPTLTPLTPAPVAAVKTNAPVTAAPKTAAPVSTCGAAANPWGYTFCGGSFISAPPSNFCSYFSCIASFAGGAGYVMQCGDGMFSKSGGRSGSCSGHGGNSRALYAP